jgi:putative transposase
LRRVLWGTPAERLKALLLEKADEFSLTIHTIEIRPDHVHLFLECDPTFSVSEITNRLKGYTSRILRQEFGLLRSRLPTLWSRSYYAASVGHVSENSVRKYIESQKGK